MATLSKCCRLHVHTAVYLGLLIAPQNHYHMLCLHRSKQESGLVRQDNNDTYKEMDGYKLAQHNEESATYN